MRHNKTCNQKVKEYGGRGCYCHYQTMKPLKLSGNMTLQQKAEARAKELGVTLEISGGRYTELLVQAPKGRVFVGSQLHEAVLEKNAFFSGNIWKAAIEEMAMGLEDCSEKGCDWCDSMNAQEVR